MAGKARLFVKKFSIFLNVLAAFIFLVASIAPFLHPSKWWYISFLGLGFAGLLIALLLFMIFWLFLKPKYMLISFVALLFGWKSIAVFFAVHPATQFNDKKSETAFRIVHWNVARFTEWKRNNNKGSQTRLQMMDLIQKQKADVLCFQEFFTSSDPDYYDNLEHVMKTIGYPYFFYSWDEFDRQQWSGQVIFSKYPIIDSAKSRFPRPGTPEAVLYADILFNKDTVRIFTTHMQSYRLRKEDYRRIEQIKNTEDSLIENSKSIFSKLKRATILRSNQADMLKKELRSCPYPYVLTLDMNDVPNSYSYFTIREGIQDAFLQKGFGIGRTFNGLSPTLRIDYIFASNDFSVQQFKRIARDMSDHYMLVADLLLKTPAQTVSK